MELFLRWEIWHVGLLFEVDSIIQCILSLPIRLWCGWGRRGRSRFLKRPNLPDRFTGRFDDVYLILTTLLISFVIYTYFIYWKSTIQFFYKLVFKCEVMKYKSEQASLSFEWIFNENMCNKSLVFVGLPDWVSPVPFSTDLLQHFQFPSQRIRKTCFTDN